MKLKRLAEDVYQLGLGNVNAYLVRTKQGLVLIDTGMAGNADRILRAIESLGHRREDLKTILLTHGHPDHAGSAAALKRAVPAASVYAGTDDAPIVERGLDQRPMKPAPGLMNRIFFRLFVKNTPVEPVRLDGLLTANEPLAFADGLVCIPAPGHSLGQLAFLLPRHGGILFAADAASNMTGLGWCIGYEDLAAAKRSLIRLSSHEFSIACFGHGKPIMQDAAARFRRKWAQ